LYQHRKLGLATVPAVAAVLLLAGCSGSNDAATAPPSLTFATDVSVTPGMAGMSSMPGMPGMPAMPAPAPGAGTPVPAPQGPDAVDITNFAFAPLTLTVPVGATVTWTNGDEEPHTVAASDGSFHSPGMGTGGTYSFTFTNVGSYDYVCSIHPFMHGTVVVTR
jgi:plastocyanin